MYVQTSRTTINGKTYECKTVRESYRTPKGPRNRTVCNISKLPDFIQSAIETLLKNPQDSLVPSSSLELHSALSFGGIAVLQDAWEHYKLDSVLHEVSDPIIRGRIKAMIFARLLFPGSKLSLKRLSADSALAAACGLSQKDLDEDLLYEAMDALSGRWSGIEKNLYNISYPDGLTLVLYDLTSSYFEGAKNKKLSAYGHSRDHRCDRQQVILALATSAEGIPVHIEVLKGNRSDSKTLLPLLETMKRRFGITKAVFCFDGGMSSFLNLQQMRDDEIDYVTRLSKPSLAALVETLPVNKQPELWDRTELVEFEIEGIRYVVAGSQYRQQRDFERREVRIEKGRKALIKFNQVKRKKIDLCKLSSQVGRMLERNKCLKYFDFSIQDNGQAIWTEKQELINAEERFDGWYLLTTSLSAKEADKTNILSHYKNLMAVENAFRETKNYLEVRPIYHQKDNRVRNHIRICFLAYWISAKLSTQWKELEENSEVTLILKELQQIRIGKIKIGENKLKLSMTEIPNRLYSILENLNLLNLFKKIPKWVS